MCWINLGEMPPAEEPQPTREEANKAIDTLTAALTRAYEIARSSSGHTALRRLNRHELRNTFRDLLYLRGVLGQEQAEGAGQRC